MNIMIFSTIFRGIFHDALRWIHTKISACYHAERIAMAFMRKKVKPEYMFKETQNAGFYSKMPILGNFLSLTFELWHFHKHFDANFIALCGVLLTYGIQVEEKCGNVTKYDISIQTLCHFPFFSSNDRNSVVFVLNVAFVSFEIIPSLPCNQLFGSL